MSDPTHICVDVRALPWSGIGRYLSENLRRLICDPRFRWTLLGDPKEIHHAGLAIGERVAHRSWTTPIFSPVEQIQYPAKVPSCDIFWGGHFNMPLLPIRSRRRAVTIYDLQTLAQPEQRSRARRLYASLLYRRSARAHEVFTISDFSAAQIDRFLRVQPSRVHRIYCGVDPRFPEGADPQPRPGAPYVLFVGNVKPHKNLDGAFKAVLALSKRRPGIRLVIVGKREGFHTPDRRIEKLIEGRDDLVHFTGRISDAELKAWYRDAQAFLFPSFYEGFGLPILEALSFALPVVSSRAASLPEVGRAMVHYADPGDVEGMARALEEALESPRPSRVAIDEHLKLFSWDQSARAHAEVLASM